MRFNLPTIILTYFKYIVQWLLVSTHFYNFNDKEAVNKCFYNKCEILSKLLNKWTYVILVVWISLCVQNEGVTRGFLVLFQLWNLNVPYVCFRVKE